MGVKKNNAEVLVWKPGQSAKGVFLMKNSLVKSENSGRTLADFQSFENGSVDCFEENSNLWFRLSDIGEVLELADSSVRKMKHDKWFDDDEINTVANRNGGARITYVSESALYRILNRSNSPKAKPFERWVTKVAIPSIRKTGSYQVIPPKVDERAIALEEKKAGLARAEFLRSMALEYDGKSETYKQVLDAYAAKELTGEFILPLPQVLEKSYSATEIGKMFGVSANKIGSVAIRHDLKVQGYGAWVKDKARFSNKEVETFRYNDRAVEEIGKILKLEAEDTAKQQN